MENEGGIWKGEENGYLDVEEFPHRWSGGFLRRGLMKAGGRWWHGTGDRGLWRDRIDGGLTTRREEDSKMRC